MKDDFCLHKSTFKYFFEMCRELLKSDKKYRVKIVEWREKRSLSQNSLQHVIYGEVSKYLIGKGRTEWTPEKVKENLKNKFLGWQNNEFIDVETGEVINMSVLVPTSKLDKGESFNYTTQIIEWSESIGCEIKIPATCEYRSLMDLQNE